jgi:hypothetical protein
MFGAQLRPHIGDLFKERADGPGVAPVNAAQRSSVEIAGSVCVISGSCRRDELRPDGGEDGIAAGPDQCDRRQAFNLNEVGFEAVDRVVGESARDESLHPPFLFESAMGIKEERLVKLEGRPRLPKLTR